jgi:hypothetical protein
LLGAAQLDEHPKDRISFQPTGLGLDKARKLPRALIIRLPMRRREIRKGPAQCGVFRDLHFAPAHRARPQHFHLVLFADGGEFRRLQIRHPAEIERGRLESHGADCIVRGMIRARLIDRQQLHAPVTESRRPRDEIPQRAHIATAEIRIAPQGK